jgi:hypothetical protein
MVELAKISSATNAQKINPDLVNRLPVITVDLAALVNLDGLSMRDDQKLWRWSRQRPR